MPRTFSGETFLYLEQKQNRTRNRNRRVDHTRVDPNFMLILEKIFCIHGYLQFTGLFCLLIWNMKMPLSQRHILQDVLTQVLLCVIGLMSHRSFVKCKKKIRALVSLIFVLTIWNMIRSSYQNLLNLENENESTNILKIRESSTISKLIFLGFLYSCSNNSCCNDPHAYCLLFIHAC